MSKEDTLTQPTESAEQGLYPMSEPHFAPLEMVYDPNPHPFTEPGEATDWFRTAAINLYEHGYAGDGNWWHKSGQGVSIEKEPDGYVLYDPHKRIDHYKLVVDDEFGGRYVIVHDIGPDEPYSTERSRTKISYTTKSANDKDYTSVAIHDSMFNRTKYEADKPYQKAMRKYMWEEFAIGRYEDDELDGVYDPKLKIIRQSELTDEEVAEAKQRYIDLANQATVALTNRLAAYRPWDMRQLPYLPKDESIEREQLEQKDGEFISKIDVVEK